MVSASDSQSDGPRFESRSCRFLDLFLVCPKFKSSAMLVNSQLVVSYQLASLNCYVAFDLFVCKHFSDTQLGSHYSEPSGQRVGLAIRWSPVRVPLLPLSGFVLGMSQVQILGHACK